MAPLNHDQKRILSQMSDRAFRFLGAKARGRGEEWPADTTKELAAFRHAEVAKAVNKLGLRCCSQADYGTIKAHFLHLLGEDGRALKAHVHAASQEERQAEVVLWREIMAARDCGITPYYMETICRRQFGCTIVEASPKQKWNLVYTVRNRAAAKRKQAQAHAA